MCVGHYTDLQNCGHSGTRSARSTSTSAVEASVILAISEGRGKARGEVGMAAVDLRHPHLVLCQFSDTLLYTHTMTKINYFNPVEIIVPHTFCEGVQPNQLYRLIRDQYPLINLTTVQRRHFNDAAGRQQIRTLCAPQYSAVFLQALHKFYAITAAAAVLKYVEYIQCIVFARESLKIEYHSSENTMIIDVGTATQLELVQPLVPSAGQTCCLLGVLGPTYTIGGIRALRAAILQPSCNKDFIENRLDAIQDLIENDSGLMTSLQDVVKKLSEVDKILFLCVESPNQGMDKFGEAQLNQILLLKTTMDVVPKFVEALGGANSGKLKNMKTEFENPHYNEIAERIHNIIQEDAHLEKGAMGSLQRCFAVKPNINGLLDVARRTYSELIDDIQKIIEQLSESCDLPLRLNQNAMKGFHIVMPIAPKNRRHFNVSDLPSIFILVQFNGASVTMTTEELVVLDHQAKESLNEIQKMSNIVISGLLKELRPYMSSLYKLCENIAELDILLALAQASTIGSYIRPEFSNYLEIRNSVHPLLDYNSQVMPVPNDIIATPEYNFTIITGPNMGGKSIYIKQIAMMQIMAQLGCFLPATNAVLRLCDRMFSRMGFNDSVELNASTYVVEMKEMQHILKGLTKSSLVIIDELCRGTSTEEGTSIAWAISEELLMSDAFTFFTTHFIYLTRLQDLYFNVVNRHTVVTEEVTNNNSNNSQKRLVYQHKVELGTTKIDHYGLALAAKTNLPEDTVKLAGELAELIMKQRKPQEIKSPQINDDEILYKLNAEIRQESRKHENSDEKIKQIIRTFKEYHPQLIGILKIQRGRNDMSINFSSVSSAKEQTSDEVAITNANNSSVNAKTPPRQLKPVIFNSSTDSNQIENCDEENEKSFRRNSSNGNPPKPHNKVVTVYSASDEDGIDSFKPDDNRTYISVKSSSDMFTTLMNIDNNKEEASTEIVRKTSHDTCQDTVLPYKEKENSNDFNNNQICSDNSNNDKRKTISDEDNLTNASVLDETDSEFAEALTQVIEDYFDEDCSENSSDVLTDKELMEETVQQINDELQRNMSMNIENLTLTPPPGFRD